MTRRGRSAVLALLVLGAALVGCAPKPNDADDSPAPAQAPQAPSARTAEAPKSGIRLLGSPEAPVKVVAYFPDNDTHVETIAFFESLPERFGEAVSVEMVDFESDDGFDRWLADGFTCGAAAINGRTHWTFTRDGKPAEATFRQKMGVDWFQEDLIAVLEMLVEDTGAARTSPESGAESGGN